MATRKPKQPPLRRLIRVPARGTAREAASFVAQLDALSATMFGELAGITPAELGWQPGTRASRARGTGMNTIGMLLAHIAIVEAFWLMIATGTYTDGRLARLLGVGVDDDGMPLPPNLPPPAVLRGRTLAWYRRLHDRARRHTKRLARELGTRELDGTVERTRRSGERMVFNRRWILYHVLEHQAGHYGQMLLLRHFHRDRRRRA